MAAAKRRADAAKAKREAEIREADLRAARVAAAASAQGHGGTGGAAPGLQQRAVVPDAELKARNDRLAAAFGTATAMAPPPAAPAQAGFGTGRAAALAPPGPPGLGGGTSPRPNNPRPPPGLAGLAPGPGLAAAPEHATVVGGSVNAPDTTVAEEATAAADTAESAEAKAKAEAEEEARNEARRAKAAADAAEHEALCKRFGFKSSTITPAPPLDFSDDSKDTDSSAAAREDISANASRRWGNSRLKLSSSRRAEEAKAELTRQRELERKERKGKRVSLGP